MYRKINMSKRLVLLSIAALFPAVAAHAGPGDAQDAAIRGVHAGAIRTVRQIEQHILPTMPGMQYLGQEYDPAAMAYRLKFIRDGRVVFVDVDARSGQIIHHSR